MDAFLVVLAACLVGSFALCGVPFGLIIAQRMSGVDVREVGSGNIA
jgi:glycerol-3-phosphate acyltransferase PlsY